MKLSTATLLGLFLVSAACSQDAPAPNSTADAAGEVDAGATVADSGSVSNANSADTPTVALSGDAAAGKRLYIYCQACHTVDAGGMNKVGPNLNGFLDRPAGQAEGFVYSSVLAESGLEWTDANLDQWLESPSKLLPGTTMVFAGIRDPQQRADLAAYLKEATGGQ